MRTSVTFTDVTNKVNSIQKTYSCIFYGNLHFRFSKYKPQHSHGTTVIEKKIAFNV